MPSGRKRTRTTPFFSKRERRDVLKSILFLLSLLLLRALLLFLHQNIVEPSGLYLKAEELMQAKDYYAAGEQFSMLGSWRDAPERVSECYLELGLSALESNAPDSAIEYYRKISDSHDAITDRMLEALYDYAVGRAKGSDWLDALSLFEGELKGYRDSGYHASGIYLELGLRQLEEASYERAYDYFKEVDAAYFADVSALLEECRKTYYDLLIDEFDAANREGGALSARVYVPEGFFSPMLDGYKDAEKYRIYSQLLGAWLAKDRERNTELVYELGDFLDTAESGFVMQRLFNRRYINSSGFYFSIIRDGSASTNIPRYRFGGYYGLYSKIENGIYYIGSDEVMWTRQFSFSFSDMDKTLSVYSFAAGSRYTLTLDESPIYG